MPSFLAESLCSARKACLAFFSTHQVYFPPVRNYSFHSLGPLTPSGDAIYFFIRSVDPSQPSILYPKPLPISYVGLSSTEIENRERAFFTRK